MGVFSLSKQKFLKARSYIKSKQYNKARTILLQIESEKAVLWLDKIDEISPLKSLFSYDDPAEAAQVMKMQSEFDFFIERRNLRQAEAMLTNIDRPEAKVLLYEVRKERLRLRVLSLSQSGKNKRGFRLSRRFAFYLFLFLLLLPLIVLAGLEVANPNSSLNTYPTFTPVVSTAVPTSRPIAVPTRLSCGSCSSMSSCSQAYACLRDGNRGLDRDGDGVPCESICPGG